MNYCNKGILLFYKPKCLLFIVLIISVLQKMNCQNIAVKSNVLYDLTSSLNIGGEIKCNDTYSISSIISYNPWTFADNRKMKHLLIQPELRKWFGDVFQGSFVGIQLIMLVLMSEGYCPIIVFKEIWLVAGFPMDING